MSDRSSPEIILQRQGPPIIRPSWLFSVILGIVAVILVALFAIDSYFVVEPTEMAGVRRLGQVITTKPLGPGPHFKLPFIDQVDRLQVSLDTFKLDRLTVNTIDNQPIAVTVGLTYRIPPPAVLPLLYEVGRAGNFDITENFERIVADRTAKIEGESRAAVLRMNADILKTSPLVVDLAKADRWNGALPLTLLEGTGSVPLLSLQPGEASEKK